MTADSCKLASGEFPASRQLTAEIIVAKSVSEITLGIDVSQDELVIYDWDRQQLTTLANQPAEISPEISPQL